MLSEEQVDLIVDRLIRRTQKANITFLQAMGENIKKIKALKPSEAEQLIQILKYGTSYDEIVREIAKQTNLNVSEIDEIFKIYAKRDQHFYKQFYKYRNIPFIEYEQNEALKRQTMALSNIVKNEMYNFTRTNVLGYSIKDLQGNVQFMGLRDTYNRVLDEAMLNVSRGIETFDSAMSSIMKDIGGSGLKTINYQSGRSVRLDSAVRMHLKGRLRELHNENQKIIGEEFGFDGWEIDVHSNPAPDHQEAQGRQFTIAEYDRLQNIGFAVDYKGREINMHLDRKTTISQGLSFRPISEYNCYHKAFAIILGVSEPEYNDKELEKIKQDNDKGFEYDGKHYSMYDGTQLQRNIELELRKAKDTQILAKASDNMELVKESQERITQFTNKYKELVNISGLPSKLSRAKVTGYRRTKVK